MLETIAPDLIVRTERSEAMRRRLVKALNSRITDLLDGKHICIYATGSYGRKEAWVDDSGVSRSDIDLFILDTALEDGDTINRLTTIQLQALLISTAKDLGFPDFDGDGKFLEVHRLDEMKGEIGSDREDARNFFTARLLLLLESHPLVGEDHYDKAIALFAGEYLRDAGGREDSFRPAFIMNDISRFWRTLCLNYEYRRYSAQSDQERSTRRLKNLKLGFSRMLTCYSALVLLASTYRQNLTVRTQDILQLASQTPIQRLVTVAERHDDLADQIATIVECYAWFLRELGQEKERAYALLDAEIGRAEAADQQKDFHLGLLHVYKALILDTQLERFALI